MPPGGSYHPTKTRPGNPGAKKNLGKERERMTNHDACRKGYEIAQRLEQSYLAKQREKERSENPVFGRSPGAQSCAKLLDNNPTKPT